MQPPETTPVFDSTPLITQYSHNFTGRQWVFAEIDDWLANHTAPRFFIITGAPGIGKTAVATQLAQRKELAATHFCIAHKADTIDPLKFAHSLSYQLTRIDGFARGILEDHGIHFENHVNIREHYGQVIMVQIKNLTLPSDSAVLAFSRTVTTPLQKLYADGFDRQLVILVDALDEAVQLQGQESIVALLANAQGIPEQVRFVLTTRPDSAALRHFEQLHIPYLLLDSGRAENLQDIQEYVRSQLATSQALQARLAEQNMLPQQFINRVTTASEGNFLYLVYLLPAIENGAQRFDALEALPKGLDGIYKDFLLTRKLGRDLDQWENRYRPVMGVLAAAQDTLTRDQLAQLTKLGRQAVTDIVRDLNQFLDPVSAAQGMYRLYHQSMTDFLQDEQRAKEFWIDLEEVHRSIAEKYARDYDSHWQACDPYGLRYLPVHLMSAGQGETLRRLLFTFDWLQAKLVASDVNVIIDDYKLLPNDEDLRLVQETIQLAGHILTRDKTQLAGQLLGRLGSSKNDLIQSMLKDAKAWRTTCWWLRPLTQSLEPAGGLLLRSLSEHPGGIRALAITPDGKKLVSAHSSFNDNTLKVWDIESGEILHTLTSHTLIGLVAIALTHDGKLAISGSLDGVLEIWDIESGKQLRVLKEYHTGIMGIVVTPNWRIVSWGFTGNLRVWDVKKRPSTREEWDLGSSVSAMALTPDGKRVVFASFEFTLPGMPARPQPETGLKVWDIGSDREPYTLTEEDVKAVAVTPDGSQAISVSEDGTLTIWDLHRRSNLQTLTGQGKATPPVIVTPDGKFVLSAAENHTIQGWDLNSGEQRFMLQGHTASVSALAVTPNGQRAVSAGDGTLKVWTLQSQGQQHTLPSHTAAVTAVAIMPDGQHAVSASIDGTLCIWHLASGEKLRTLRDLTTSLAIIVPMDNEHVIAVSHNGSWNMWSLASGEPMLPQLGHSSSYRATTITSDGRQVVSIDHTTLGVWDLQSGEQLHSLTLTQLTSPIMQVAVTPDRQQVVTAESDGPMKVWSLKSGALLHQLTAYTFVVSAIVTTPDSARVVSGVRDGGTLQVWDLKNGQQLYSLQGHTKIVRTIATTSDSKRAISVSDDYTLKVWDLASGASLASFSGDSPLLTCAVVLDGLTIVAGEKSGRMHFLRLEEPG